MLTILGFALKEFHDGLPFGIFMLVVAVCLIPVLRKTTKYVWVQTTLRRISYARGSSLTLPKRMGAPGLDFQTRDPRTPPRAPNFDQRGQGLKCHAGR